MEIRLTIGENCKKGDNLGSTLAALGGAVIMPCGGLGSCGKCAVRVVSPVISVSEEDRAFFDDEKLSEGMRLACSHVISEDMCVEVLEGMKEEDISIPDDMLSCSDGAEEKSNIDYSFAVDIGTTTVAVAAVNAVTGTVFDSYAGINHQRSFGNDVISRIVASNNGYGPNMRDMVIVDINDGIAKLMERNRLRVERLERIVIAGNTAMQHIFAGYSCEGLAMSPFSPVSTELTDTPSGTLMPGISAFVGADILSGIYFCHMAEDKHEDGLSLLLDLGTNGEMALGNSQRILVASTAAGPAFEGGNISCGTASVPGAIYDVELHDDDAVPIVLRIIGEQDAAMTAEGIPTAVPRGICGTGVIALAAELKRNKLIDDTGLLDERLGRKIKLTEDGKVTFTQKDIRELQLAKAAVRAGIETLMFTYGAEYDDIAHLYIAGGFGSMLDVHKAAMIGLIPKELEPVAEAIGNASLGGAVRYLTEGASAKTELERIKAISSEVELAGNSYFASRFILSM